MTTMNAASSPSSSRPLAPHRVPAGPEGPAEARRWIRRLHLPLSEDRMSDLLVIVTELVTNAIRHARPLPGGIVSINAEADPQSITITVTDGGSTSTPTVRTIDLSSVGGRGLYLVAHLADAWNSDRCIDGTHKISARVLF